MVRKRPIKTPRLNEGERLRAPSDSGGSTQGALVCLGFQYFRAESFAACGQDHLALWTDLLRRLCSCTWQTVMSAPREKLGYEKFPRDELPAHVTSGLPADIEFVLIFRCSIKMRMLGLRSRERLEIVWLDPFHKAYPGG